MSDTDSGLINQIGRRSRTTTPLSPLDISRIDRNRIFLSYSRSTMRRPAL